MIPPTALPAALPISLCWQAVGGQAAVITKVQPTTVGFIRRTVSGHVGFPGPYPDLTRWPDDRLAARCMERAIGAARGTPPINCTAEMYALPDGSGVSISGAIPCPRPT